MGQRIRECIQDQQRAVAPAPSPVAGQKLLPLPQPLVARQSLTPGRSRRPIGHAQAESFLRPFRRRCLMIARPARVDMRARNPWFFLRLRLLG